MKQRVLTLALVCLGFAVCAQAAQAQSITSVPTKGQYPNGQFWIQAAGTWTTGFGQQGLHINVEFGWIQGFNFIPFNPPVTETIPVAGGGNQTAYTGSQRVVQQGFTYGVKVTLTYRPLGGGQATTNPAVLGLVTP